MSDRKFFHEAGNFLMMAKGMLEVSQSLLDKKIAAGAVQPISAEEMKTILHKLERANENMDRLEKLILEEKLKQFPQ